MTRDEAIRILDPVTTGEAISEIEYYGGFSGRTKAAQAVSDACVLAVAALREQENRGWIPVTERLPEKEGEYITYTDKGEIHFDCFCIYPNHGTKFWVGGNGKVTHWMPLPEPPKGE